MPKVAPPLAQPGAAACHRVSTSDASFTRAINVSVGDAPFGAMGETVTSPARSRSHCRVRPTSSAGSGWNSGVSGL